MWSIGKINWFLIDGNKGAVHVCLLLPLLVKIDSVTFEVNMTDHSQDTTKKLSQWQLKVMLYKQFIV